MKPPATAELIRDPAVMKRMQLALDLYELSEGIMRQNLRRRNPAATDEEIEQGVREWLRRRPGAEHGDAAGVPSTRFRQR